MLHAKDGHVRRALPFGKRRSAGRKAAAIMAAALFVVAQPQVFCALHCSFHWSHWSHRSGGARTMDMPCNHGATLTSGSHVPVGSVSVAVRAVADLPFFVVVAPASTFFSPPTSSNGLTPSVDPPPPRA